jgi:protein SCO1/2
MAICLGLIVVLGTFLLGQSNTQRTSGSAEGRGMAIVGEARIGGPFTLTNHFGEPVDQSILEGQSTFVFFGFTYCPDFCPMGLQKIKIAKDIIGDAAADVRTVFITIDPERDTPEALKSYLDSPVIPDGALGLPGTPEQIRSAADTFIAQYERAPGSEGADYLMNHSTYIYLMGPDGKFDRLFLHSDAPSEIAEGLRQHLGAVG